MIIPLVGSGSARGSTVCAVHKVKLVKNCEELWRWEWIIALWSLTWNKRVNKGFTNLLLHSHRSFGDRFNRHRFIWFTQFTHLSCWFPHIRIDKNWSLGARPTAASWSRSSPAERLNIGKRYGSSEPMSWCNRLGNLFLENHCNSNLYSFTIQKYQSNTIVLL